MSEPNASAAKDVKGSGRLRPAFSSTRQAMCFLLLLVTILLLPEVSSWSPAVNRRQSYEIMTPKHGAYEFVAKEIFDDPRDIDLLFLGSSILFSGVDTPKVQQALSAELGRPARAITFGHYFNSIDVMYMQLRDALERKRVRMVIVAIPRVPYTDGPSTMGCRFVRYSEIPEIYDELPLRYKAAMYSCAMLRAPRDMLSMVRPKPRTASPAPFESDLGMDKAEIGDGRDPAKFVSFVPPAPSIRSEEMIFSERTREKFDFINEEIPFYQDLYLEKLVELSRMNRIPLAVLNIPQYTERRSDRVVERMNWRSLLGQDVQMIGVPPAVLFSKLSDEDIDKLRFDDAHLNANGSEFFTNAVLPGILEVYRSYAAKGD